MNVYDNHKAWSEEIMSNMEKYTNVFTEVFGVDASVLDSGFTFENVEEWDSLSHLTLISELEETFDIMFETDDILHFGGFMNGIDILKKYGVIF